VTETILQDVFQLPTGLAVERSTIEQAGQLLGFIEANSRAIQEEMLARLVLGHHPQDPVFFGAAATPAIAANMAHLTSGLNDPSRSHARHAEMIPEPHLTLASDGAASPLIPQRSGAQ